MLIREVVLASENPGKLREMNALLNGLDIEVIPQSRFSIPEVAETGISFVENSIIKARNAALHTKLPTIADDSGLEVDVLAGASPGVFSARYAGESASDEENLDLLIEMIKGTNEERPTARFQCSIVFLRNAEDAMPIIAQGTWHGHIITTPKGENGFGYDPVFYVPTHSCTSAELKPAEKNKISHRAQAMQELIDKLSVVNSNSALDSHN